MSKIPKIDRFLNINKLIKQKSYILLGPRQTGKSYLIRESLGKHKKYNLLLKEDFKKLSFDPTLIRKELTAKDKIINDEVGISLHLEAKK